VADKNSLLILGGLGIAGYFAYTQGWLSNLFGATLPSAAGGAPVGTQTAAVPALTAADAATYPYSSAITSDQMKAISGTLNAQIQAGQIPQIAGGSVLAYMLGWGGASPGATKTQSGETYAYDGANWNLQQAPSSAAAMTTASTPAVVSAKALSDALNAWATANGYPPPLTVSQWNWILNNKIVPGTQAEMSGPANPISAKDYVKLLQGDTSYDTSAITPKYALSGLGDDQVDDGYMLYAHPWAPSRVSMAFIHGGPKLRFWRNG